MILSKICIKRPVFATVMSLLIIVVGLMFYGRLEVRNIPDISPPIITVTSRFEGADAAYMEQNITTPIEKAMRTVKNVESIKSTSEEAQSNIRIKFKLSSDINDAMSDVRSKIAEISGSFPKDMQLPSVQKMDSSAQASIYITATGSIYDDMELTEILDKNLVKSFEKMEEVGQVQRIGFRYYNMKIIPDPVAMYGLKFTPLEIETAIRSQNKDHPAGVVKTDGGNFAIKLGGALTKPEEFENIILRSNKDGMIKLFQVAEVKLGPYEDDMTASYNGKKCMAIGLVVQSSSNILELSKAVNKQLPKLQKELPKGIKLQIAYDEAIPVDASINSVYTTLFEALILVVGVVYLFLRSASLTIIPFVTIPVSLIGTFAFMYALGFSINTFTLLAMILAIGLVVDDAIVMLENIFRHYELKQSYGSNAFNAAISASGEIGFAIIAMTITLAAVFLPIGFDSGFTSRVFIEFAWTLAFCVIISGFVALTLTPMMAARMIGYGYSTNDELHPDSAFLTRFQGYITRINLSYINHLKKMLINQKQFWLICSSSILILVICLIFIPKSSVPEEDNGYLMAFINGPEGSSAQHMDMGIHKMEEILSLYKDIKSYFTGTYGGNFAFAFISLKPWSDRNKSAQQIQQELNNRFKEITEVSVFAISPQDIRGGGADENPVEFHLISSAEWNDLNAESIKIEDDMQKSNIFENIQSDLKTSTPTLNINVDRDKVYLYGISMEDIGATLQYLISGRNVGDFRMNNETYEVTMRYARDDRSKISDLSKIYLKNKNNQLYYLDSVADVEETVSIKSYNHRNNSRAVKITSSLKEGAKLNEAINFIKKLKENEDRKFNIEFSGQIKEMQESGSSLLQLFTLALVFIYLVLAVQFESWIDPLIILCAVPFSITGGVLGLFISGLTLNLYSKIGLITLIGLITKNSIMIVEFAGKLREEGLDKTNAVIEAAKMRFRPILMTTLATVLGAIPLALANGAGAGARNSIGVMIVGGMLLGTVFTLFVIPILYNRFKK